MARFMAVILACGPSAIGLATGGKDHQPMHSQQLTTGRTFGIRFDPGESFFPALEEFCTSHGIRYGYIPMFLAAFAEAEIVGACEKIENPAAPVWTRVHLTNAEALGCGTIAYDQDAGSIRPHVTLGLKERAADGYTSHLLTARVQFLVEMILVEVTSPAMTRPADPALYDVPRLTFGNEAAD
jgi:predicted DNA-binding protein with PD1-like motif